jgi:hypothetical protein
VSKNPSLNISLGFMVEILSAASRKLQTLINNL